MNLYYAFGGGLGHLTRANAFMYTLGIQPDQFLVLTSSKHAELIFSKKQLIIIDPDYYHKPLELKSLIEYHIKENQVQNLYLDTFPVGIAGELNGLKPDGYMLNYVARYLKWDNYLTLITEPANFDATFVVDYLADEHLQYISRNSKRSNALNLLYPPASNFSFVEKVLSEMKTPVWLIAHSGSKTELDTLNNHAREIAEQLRVNPSYLVVNQQYSYSEEDMVHSINYYPACDFFPFVDRIITACGFNVMKQTTLYVNKHIFIPFERKFDDQFMRARLRNQSIARQEQ